MIRIVFIFIAYIFSVQDVWAENIVYETFNFKIAIDENGQVASLYDKLKNKEYQSTAPSVIITK